jgi:hypothetical protein
MELEVSLPCTQDAAIGPHPMPDEFNPHTYFSSLNLILFDLTIIIIGKEYKILITQY